MPITLQELANATNAACRHGLSTTSSVDLTNATRLHLYATWANIVQRDVLHTSVWKGQLNRSETFTSEPDGSPYILSANNIRHVIAVHDLKNRYTVVPYDDMNFPAATSSPPERSGPPRTRVDQAQQSDSLHPQYYIFEACIQASDGSITQGIHLLPDPFDSDHSGTVRVFYTVMVDDVAASGDILTVPDDGFDILVTGMCVQQATYMKEYAEADLWRARYEAMKKGF